MPGTDTGWAVAACGGHVVSGTGALLAIAGFFMPWYSAAWGLLSLSGADVLRITLATVLSDARGFTLAGQPPLTIILSVPVASALLGLGAAWGLAWEVFPSVRAWVRPTSRGYSTLGSTLFQFALAGAMCLGVAVLLLHGLLSSAAALASGLPLCFAGFFLAALGASLPLKVRLTETSAPTITRVEPPLAA